jgi:aminopeptidase N
MLDVQHAPAAPPATIRREDYRAPEWRIPNIRLEFDLDAARTVVRARLQVERAEASSNTLRLDGEELELLELKIDGVAQEPRFEGDQLVVLIGGDGATVETVVAIAPSANSQLMGLYSSGGILCTQCEAEGFRRITFFPDRPDVLSRYEVRLVADKALYPVLLANGDPVAAGDLEGGRHFAEWHDPFPKPSYLFAIVAGDLACREDRFVTASGREVKLGIWVREADLPRTAHAMEALKLAMAWDERVYGREYDLGVFNIVAVADFNFGAMENKGLNIFNSRYILADPETATDADYDAIAAVVAHEYFHNWSGNRITCRDWFQLSLKEGFTVLRDQQFSADQGSAAVKRIEDVRVLRAAQFPEDAGPLAHPIRPESYIEISNFYTATIYNKGAEVIRMMLRMLGAEAFRKGTDLYFERHDGEAATCEDFVRAIEDGSGADLGRFRLWYRQAGTPRVTARVAYSAAEGRARLSLQQAVPSTPGQPTKEPMPVPLAIALFGEESGSKLTEQLVLLEEAVQEIEFDGINERPVLSINRGFSAPIVLETDRTAADLAFLSGTDDDPFARYEAMQQLMLDTLVADVSGNGAIADVVIRAVRRTLSDNALDPAFVGEAVVLPSEAFVGDQMLTIDPDAIHAARERLRALLGRELESLWRGLREQHRAATYEYSPAAKGARRLANVSLGYLAAAGAADSAALAFKHYQSADNMTDRMGALTVLANSEAPERIVALEDFHQRYRSDALVLDKWFTVQALANRAETLDAVQQLARHEDFTLANPNRVRALIGAFASNQRAFHDGSGRGYAFLADMILKVDALNPQTAARLVPPLGRWRRFDEARGRAMQGALRGIVAHAGISRDVFEQASKSLEG